MPTTEDNERYWNGQYDWRRRGDEWSRDWGSVSMQWYGTILPRIHRFLPCRTIVEIGCGYGRWTQFLREGASRLIGVDLSAQCVRACQERFSGVPATTFHRNDGCLLEAAEDNSVDFVFSFDALPLADAATIRAYLSEISRVLTNDGAAFLHHSNLGDYAGLYRQVRRIRGLEALLTRLKLLDDDLYWRDPSVSATLVDHLASSVGLRVVSQEVFRWGTRFLAIEAFSTVARRGSKWQYRGPRVTNRSFDWEAARLRSLARLYAPDDDSLG